MSSHRKYLIILLLIFILVPQTLLANAGTALMWMPILQLVFGNIMIGIVEALIVFLIFRTKLSHTILIMVGGNYASWIIGNVLILLLQEFLIDSVFQLNGVFQAWIISLIILYILTVLIEIPFFNWVFNKEKRNWKRSLRLSVILNVVTYTAMILLYLSVSKYNFFTDLDINQSLLDNNYDYELIIKRDKEVYKGAISNDFQGEKIFQIPEHYKYLHFSLKEDKEKVSIDLLLANYSGDTLLFQDSFIEKEEKIFYPNLYKKYSWIKSDFRDTINRNWNATAGGWAIDGLTIKHENEVKENYAFEVPWMFWGIGQVSIINDKELICEIYGRLILVNKDTKKITYITKSDNYMLKKTK